MIQSCAGDLNVSARQLRSLPQPTVHHAAVFDSEQAEIIVLGGAKQAGGAPHRDIWVYSIVDDAWDSSIPSLPSARAESSAVIAEGMLYLWGSGMVRSCGHSQDSQIRLRRAQLCAAHIEFEVAVMSNERLICVNST